MSEERVDSDSAEWEALAAIACFAGAGFSLAFGFIFTTRSLLNAQLHPWLHGVGLLFLVIGLPILILGGHFMDLGERKPQHGDRREAVNSR